jgi:large subunit ribosomal protein L10
MEGGAMSKSDKVSTVAEIADQFRSSSAAVVTEYRGLKMAQLSTLRRSLGSETSYTVAKNTLVKRAAADAGITGLDDMFSGPTAVAFIAGEPVEAAKALREFAKTNPLLVIKGGLLDGRPLDAAEVSKLADLESREVLLAKLAGAMLGTLTKAAVVLNALPTKVAQLVAALAEKNASGAPAPEATDEAAPEATDEAATEATADSAPDATADAAPEGVADAAPAATADVPPDAAEIPSV